MNANAQHTPGEWQLDLAGIVYAPPLADDTDTSIHICDVARGVEATDEEMANGRLIAAAPNLLGFASAVADIVRSSGANLCSTATDAERSAFISGILDAWNNGGYDAIANATGAAS